MVHSIKIGENIIKTVINSKGVQQDIIIGNNLYNTSKRRTSK